MQIWCQGCNEWYESEENTSVCPFCDTINYRGEDDVQNSDIRKNVKGY